MFRCSALRGDGAEGGMKVEESSFMLGLGNVMWAFVLAVARLEAAREGCCGAGQSSPRSCAVLVTSTRCWRRRKWKQAYQSIRTSVKGRRRC